jgi:hypothetical protein
VPQLLTVVELKTNLENGKFLGVKLIDFKDYPALLISNDDNLQSSPIGFGPALWGSLLYK